jgi:hypothetical protein
MPRNNECFFRAQTLEKQLQNFENTKSKNKKLFIKECKFNQISLKPNMKHAILIIHLYFLLLIGIKV